MSFSEWQEVKLGDICDIVMGQSPKGEFCNDKGIGTPLLNGPTEFGQFYPRVMQYTTEVKKQSIKGDLLFCVRGSTTGRMNWADKEYAIGRGLATIHHKKGIGYKSFVKGLMDYKLNEILNSATGSTFPNVGKDLLNSLPVCVPPLPEQKVIANTLSCLDDKIELNTRINKTLEEMAQAIFKSWFVDFEPFQDGEFEDSELGRIPKGWRVGTMGELILDTLGGDWGKESLQGNSTEEVICIRGADIPEIACGRKGKPAVRFILKKNLDKKQLSEGQIIIEISGGSPTQSTGRTSLITKELVSMADKPLICTNFCRALSFDRHSHSTFVYSMLQYQYNKDLFFLYENGTTGIKNLDTNSLFNQYRIVLPTHQVMIKYEDIFNTLLKIIYENGNQSDELSTIRDTLLPKLMTGEIRIPIQEAE